MKPSNARLRRGSVIIAALVCLAVVMALVGNMLVGAMRMGRQMHIERDRRQCELLLEAGLNRAVRQATAAQNYPGEVWAVPAAEIGGLGNGQVTIRISEPASVPKQISVLAEYPIGSEQSIRRSRVFQLQSTSPLSQE